MQAKSQCMFKRPWALTRDTMVILCSINTNHLFSVRQPLLNELHCLSCHFLLNSIQTGVGMASMEGHHHKTLKTCWLGKLSPARVRGEQPLRLPRAIRVHCLHAIDKHSIPLIQVLIHTFFVVNKIFVCTEWQIFLRKNGLLMLTYTAIIWLAFDMNIVT